MATKLAPHPPIADETMQALLAATTQFTALSPWEYMYDSDVVGLVDPRTGERHLATILGNAGEVFGVVFYRGSSGIRWLLSLLNGPEEGINLENIDAMDALKVELVPRNELKKEELGILKRLNFKPAGRGVVWPKFQSVRPGWLPWFINQEEAEKLILHLPRLTAFAAFFRDHSDLFDDRSAAEIPFLPNPMPERALQFEDLDWQPMLAAPESFAPFQADSGQMDQLRPLERKPRAAFEYGNRLLLGGTVLEKGRPCYSRASLLADHASGLVLGFQIELAITSFTRCAGDGLVKTLLDSGSLPGAILIDDDRLEPVLGPFCRALEIKLNLVEELTNLEEVMASLEAPMAFP